jgi:hypothetical protein
MKRFLLLLASIAAATASFGADGRHMIGGDESHTIDKATVLPLALDDAFQFRKQIVQLNDPRFYRPTTDPMIQFERNRPFYGAIQGYERRQRWGHYFVFLWRATRKADLTIRFEFRQQELGAFVQAKELNYKDAKGSYRSEFDVIGDRYAQDGKVNGWRALMIENGKIVALTQSFLWN